ncbi:MAG: LamG domain-containing protein [Pyrinomonadaceae bacterium]
MTAPISRTPTFFIDDGTLYCEFSDFVIQPVSSVSANQWYHVAMTYDSSYNVKVYLNGVLTTQGVASDPGVLNAVGIGAYVAYAPDGAEQFFNGLVDEIRLYGRPLSATEVKDTYDGKSVTTGLLSWHFSARELPKLL